MDFLALLYVALARLKTVTTFKRLILRRRLTLKIESSETCSMDKVMRRKVTAP